MTTATKGNIKFSRKTIFVNISKSLRGEIYDVLPTMPLVDVARGYWNVSSKASQCEVLAAVDKGVVVGVWEINRSKGWMPSQRRSIKTRGSIIPDPNCKYCEVTTAQPNCPINGKPVSSIVGVWRMYGPVRYNF